MSVRLPFRFWVNPPAAKVTKIVSFAVLEPLSLLSSQKSAIAKITKFVIFAVSVLRP